MPAIVLSRPQHVGEPFQLGVGISSAFLMKGEQQIGCSHLYEARDIVARLALEAPDVHVYTTGLAWLDAQIAGHCGK
jgi:hypothetical protein